MRHGGPAKGHQNHRCDKLVDRSAGVARAVHAHRHALATLGKPPRHIGRADRECAARQPHKQACDEEMPILGRITHHPDRRNGQCHQHGHDDAATVFVGPDTQGHPHQRTRQHGHRRKQAKLGRVQVQHLLDRNPDHAEHHPDHETHGERERTDDQDRPRLAVVPQVVFRWIQATIGCSGSRFDHGGALF